MGVSRVNRCKQLAQRSCYEEIRDKIWDWIQEDMIFFEKGDFRGIMKGGTLTMDIEDNGR